jgi:hypothetical protein
VNDQLQPLIHRAQMCGANLTDFSRRVDYVRTAQLLP